jgi:two-component system, NarL family, sensor histidine kinase DesK
VDAGIESASPAEAEWVASQRRWTRGWRKYLFVVLPLLYMIYVGGAVAQNSRGAAAVAGYLVLAAFCGTWLVAPALLSAEGSSTRYWIFFAILAVLFVAELPFARAAAFVMCLFIVMITVARLGGHSVPFVVALALAALIVPVAVPSWHVSLAESFADFTPLAIPVVALVTFAVMQVLRGNQALAEARAELARLSAENERMRIARDLHDLLGHSLTTITVKAGLARKLGAVDPGRANQEIGEVEALARRALSDVRAAVSNYREVTLAGELAAGRELLRAAGVAAELPGAIDDVDPTYQELFGWVVREGLTNVVRHAHASSCAIRLSAFSVEIVDDGVGGSEGPGNGLSGLRERVMAFGGIVDAGPLEPKGWRLQVTLSPSGGA